MSQAMNYETFLRAAFGYKQGGMLERWGDPAGIANTDSFSLENLAAVKVGTGYAVEILSNSVFNDSGQKLEDAEWSRLERFTERVINAASLIEIDKIITEFRDSVIDKYFDLHDGKMTLKSI